MKIRRITTEKSYIKAVCRIAEIWQALPGTPEEYELKLLRELMADYETIHYRPYPPDPIKVIKIRTKELNLSWKDLASCIGSEKQVEDILERKSPLTSGMVRKLSEHLKISDRWLKIRYALRTSDNSKKRAVG